MGRLARRGIVIAHGGTTPGKNSFLDEAAALAQRAFLALLADTSSPGGRGVDGHAGARAARLAFLERTLRLS